MRLGIIGTEVLRLYHALGVILGGGKLEVLSGVISFYIALYFTRVGVRIGWGLIG